MAVVVPASCACLLSAGALDATLSFDALDDCRFFFRRSIVTPLTALSAILRGIQAIARAPQACAVHGTIIGGGRLESRRGPKELSAFFTQFSDIGICKKKNQVAHDNLQHLVLSIASPA